MIVSLLLFFNGLTDEGFEGQMRQFVAVDVLVDDDIGDDEVFGCLLLALVFVGEQFGNLLYFMEIVKNDEFFDIFPQYHWREKLEIFTCQPQLLYLLVGLIEEL